MDFELSDDQLALRDGARELLDGLAPTTRVRTVVDAGGGIDHGLWKAMVEQGWTAVEVPEDRGGLGDRASRRAGAVPVDVARAGRAGAGGAGRLGRAAGRRRRDRLRRLEPA